MRKTCWVSFITLLAMFLIGLNYLIVSSPLGLGWLAQRYPALLTEATQTPGGLFPLIFNLVLILAPIFVWMAWMRDRRARAGDYTISDGGGVITITETALKKFIRAICSEVQGVDDLLVDVARSGSGVNVKLRVKVSGAEAWLPVKTDLLERIPAELAKVIGADVLNSLNIVWSDFTRDDRVFPRTTSSPRSDKAEPPSLFSVDESLSSDEKKED